MILFLAAVLSGIVTTLVIRRTSDVGALRETGKKMQAHLLEFRLFFDEPDLIWKAQISLLRDNARLLRLLLLPTLILVLPMSWLLVQLDAVYGRRPLRPGEPAIVTAQLTRPIDATDRFVLPSAGGILVETAAIRVLHGNQIVWRIRPERDVSGALNLMVNGSVIRKTIATGAARQLLSPRRYRSLVEFVLHPEESRLPDGDVAWVGVAYPEEHAGWMVWFLAVSGVTGLLSARWMRLR